MNLYKTCATLSYFTIEMVVTDALCKTKDVRAHEMQHTSLCYAIGLLLNSILNDRLNSPNNRFVKALKSSVKLIV